MVIYNLPGRDCAALASNGELGPNDLPRYQNEYINPIRDILRRPEYANLRIVAIIEIDSLPNLVTNRTNRPTGTAQCDTMFANGGYVNGVGYALAQLGSHPERLQLRGRRSSRLAGLDRQLRRLGGHDAHGRAGLGQHARQRARLHHQHREHLGAAGAVHHRWMPRRGPRAGSTSTSSTTSSPTRRPSATRR